MSDLARKMAESRSGVALLLEVPESIRDDVAERFAKVAEEHYAELVAAAKRLTRCPYAFHDEGRTLRRRDCGDDHCTNSEHVKWVECTHPSHRLVAALASLEVTDG